MTSGPSHPSPPPSAGPSGRRTRSGSALLVATALTGVVGAAAVIAGTFLPWLDSGGKGRNIYQLTAVAGKLGFLDTGFARTIPTIVGLLGPICILPIVLALLRLRRTAAAVAIACGLLTALPALAALLLGGRAGTVGVSLDPTGPLVVLFGGVLLVTAGVMGLAIRARDRAAGRSTAQGHQVTVRAQGDQTSP